MSARESDIMARRHKRVRRALADGTATRASLAAAEGIAHSTMSRWLQANGYEVQRARHPRSADPDRERARELRDSTDPPMPLSQIAERLGCSKQWVSRLLTTDGDRR